MPSSHQYDGFWGKARWLARFYRPYLHLVVLLLLLTPIHALVESVVPRMVGFTIDSLRGQELPSGGLAGTVVAAGEAVGLEVAPTFAVAFVCLGACAFMLYVLMQSTRAWTNTRLEWAFRQDAFDRATEKGPDFYQRFRIGDLVTRLTDDVAEKLSWFSCSGIFRLYEAMAKIAFVTAMMIIIDPMLTLWTAGPLPILIGIFIKGGMLLDRRYAALQKRISGVNERLEACFSGIRVVKAYAREQAQYEEFSSIAGQRRQAEIATVRAMTLIESLWHSVWQFGAVVVLLAGGWRVLHAGLSLGELAAFLYYTVWLVFPMFDVGQFVVKSRQSAVSIGRLLNLELMPPMVRDEGTSSLDVSAPPSIRFRNVDFGFETSERKILDDIDLEIGAGQTVAIVGRVGCGKSWLVNLLPRLADPVAGTVEIGGRDVRELPLEVLRKTVGYVPQEPSLFSDTIKHNIEFGRQDVDADTLDWALDISQFRADVDRFPKGIDTLVGTRGVALSGGQKQRLALARALVGRPKILILDDCTSALDSKTETSLWHRLHQVMPTLTTVVITHRPETLRRADSICVLHDGRIAEIGTHEELISAGGEYATIYRKFELEELVD